MVELRTRTEVIFLLFWAIWWVKFADLVAYDWLCDLASRTYLLLRTFELLRTLEGHCKFGIMLWLYYLYVYILRFWRKLNTTTILVFSSAYISLGLASFGRDRAEFCAWRAYSLHRGLGEPSCAYTSKHWLGLSSLQNSSCDMREKRQPDFLWTSCPVMVKLSSWTCPKCLHLML